MDPALPLLKAVDRRSSGGRARGRDSRAASEYCPERGVENLDAEIDLLLADRERRRHTEAVRARPCAHDVHGEPAATHVADLLVLRLELAQPPEEVVAPLPRLSDQALLLDHVEHREPGRCWKGVGDVRGDVEEAFPDAVLLDRTRRDRGGQWKSAAQRLRDRNEVG